METLTETAAPIEAIAVRQACDALPASPRPEWVRGVCPNCGQPVVSNCYYIGGRGYLCVWECWNSLAETPSCTYRKVL